jgi:hypothetical protein
MSSRGKPVEFDLMMKKPVLGEAVVCMMRSMMVATYGRLQSSLDGRVIFRVEMLLGWSGPVLWRIVAESLRRFVRGNADRRSYGATSIVPTVLNALRRGALAIHLIDLFSIEFVDHRVK